MENLNDESRGICRPGEPCAWGMVEENDRIDCNRGDGTCCPAPLLEAEISGFHDQSLSDATSQINQILQAIPADSAGRELAFLNTKTGILLAWVNHGNAPQAKAITAQDSPDDIQRVLKLKNR